jgi:type VI secretion system protein ImpK
MKLELWRLVISLREDIGRILERTLLPNAQSMTLSGTQGYVDIGSLTQLRLELRNRLDMLKDALQKELTENEAYLATFPLVLLCDEMVMGRLAKQQHTDWRLLQHELFQITYGGDVFYDFVDERLAKADTPPMVFEVLYFCLTAGFVGKFGLDGGKVQRYKALLTERIPGALVPVKKKRRRREPEAPPDDTAKAPPPVPIVEPPLVKRSFAWYYGVAFMTILTAAVGIFLFSNL